MSTGVNMSPTKYCMGIYGSYQIHRFYQSVSSKYPENIENILKTYFSLYYYCTEPSVKKFPEIRKFPEDYGISGYNKRR